MRWIEALLDRAVERRTRKSSPLAFGDLGVPKVACWDCGHVHQLPANLRQAFASAEEFFLRHQGHIVNWFERPALAGLWVPNADVKQAYQSADQTIALTSLNSQVVSAVVMCCAASVDNSANLFFDAELNCVVSLPATAPANSKALFVHGGSSVEAAGTDLTQPFDNTDADKTIPDFTANPLPAPLITVLPYNTSDDTVKTSTRVAHAFGGSLPRFWAIGVINHSGATVDATGNSFKYRGVYATVI